MGTQTDPRADVHVQRAWYQYDWAASAYPTPVLTVFLALYLTGIGEAAARDAGASCADGSALVDCDLGLFGATFPAGSLWGYLLVVGTVVQLVVLPVTGIVADRTGRWSTVLAACVALGAGATACLALAAGTDWVLGSVLFVVANTGFGGAQVVYNCYLPRVATREHRDAVAARGTGLGYLGAGLILVAQLVVYLGHAGFGLSEADAVRCCFLVSGLWWAGFAIRPLRALRRFDPARSPSGAPGPAYSMSVAAALRAAARYPLTLRFLGVFFVFAAGVNTVNSVAAQYGEREIGLFQDALVPILVAVQFVGAIGSALHGALAGRLGTRNAVLVSLGCWAALICIGYFVPRGFTLGYALLSCGVGLVMGGTLALSRSLFSTMIPPGQEPWFFSLFGVVDRASLAMGPMVFAAVAQLSGSFRPAMMSTLVFFVGGAVLLALLPTTRAALATQRSPTPPLPAGVDP